MNDELIKEGTDLIINFLKTGEDEEGFYLLDHPEISSALPDYKYFEFHSSWDWMMPVWEKIIEFETENVKLDRFEIGKRSVFITIYTYSENKTRPGWRHQVFSHDCYPQYGDCKDMKEVYFKTIVDIIKWYNQR
jgi:hypothetical protein